MGDVTLKVSRKVFSGWTSVSIKRSIDVLCGSFTIGYTDTGPGDNRWLIEPGAECELLLEGAPVITGYVDSSDRKISATGYTLEVQGRDKAADLVDCSAILPETICNFGQIFSQTMTAVAKSICRPFGISVRDNVGLKTLIPIITIEPEMTAFEILSRCAATQAVLTISDGLGGIVLTRAGSVTNPNALVLGETGNILEASLSRDDRDVFSTYFALGQASADSFSDPRAALHMYAEAADPQVGRYRPFVLVSSQAQTTEGLQKVVNWELRRRRARARHLRVTVVGWSQNGRLWQPNELVSVRIPDWGIEERLLISTVIFSLGEDGSKTTLHLCNPAAYDLIPLYAKADAWNAMN